MQESQTITAKSGKVILAGAGPGDPQLITIKLSKALRDADVIITDRLVNPDIIEIYAGKHAKVFFTGKQGHSDASSTMKEINSLITTYSLLGNTVLRLKGGDVAFFSNVLDELQNLIENKIPFEIIPGITAASGASAYAGIPLTARGFSQGVQFLTYYNDDQFGQEKWKQLAAYPDTLVFYMSANHATDIAGQLIKYGAKSDTLLAVIEQATTPYQEIHIATLNNCRKNFADKKFGSPSLVIIGNVVRLHEPFTWFESMATGTVFEQLT